MKKVTSVVLTAGTLSYAMLICFYCAVVFGVDHDENQFMASAYMVARHGLQPFRDFAYLQMPNLVYVYSLFFFSPHPFLVARLFSGLCSFGLCLMVLLISRSLFRPFGLLTGTLVSVVGTILLANSNLFRLGASKVWNHSSATLCAVLAFVLVNKAMREKRFAYFFLSGLALGMSAGIRLTFAPLLAPFFLAIFVLGSTSLRNKALSALTFAIGALISNLPAIYFFVTSYRDFMFGTFEYRKLTERYYLDQSHALYAIVGAPMTWTGKVQQLIDCFWLDTSNLLIPVVASLGVLLLSIAIIRKSSRPKSEVVFLVALLPFLLFGCLVATPSEIQYFFPLIPFLLLLGLFALSSLHSARLLWIGGALLVIAAGISFFNASESQKSLGKLRRGNNIAELSKVFHPSSWVPLKVAEESQWIKSHIVSRRQGKVLTLAPLFAIESGLPIYREFVTGPFAWRVSYLLSADEAAARKIPWAPGVNEWLIKERPLAVVTGVEIQPTIEAPIIREIIQLGYSPASTPNGFVLWQVLE